MTAILEVPLDLTPRALAYQDELPTVVATAIKECSNHWRIGDTDQAIQCAKHARTLAQAINNPVSESVACVWMADLYREVARPGPALECCREAISALRRQPGYEHRDHAEAVVAYLQGLLRHTLGANTAALADYDQAITSFGKAIKHWNSNVARNPARADRREKAIEWIKVLSQRLAGDRSPVSGETEMQIPAANGQDYGLARLKPEAVYRLPLEILINDEPYRMYDLHSGQAFETNDRLEVGWNTHHFVVRVQQDKWAGPYSAQGDYVLVKWKWTAGSSRGYGVFRDLNQQQWKYGTFDYNPDTGRLWFYPYHLIGGQSKEVEYEDISGIACALLKPV